MNSRKTLALLFALCLLVTKLSPAAERPVIELWPGAVPGETGQIDPQKYGPPQSDGGVLRIRCVVEPTITLFRAEADKANGSAVVVCPGGGYNILAWDKEGTEIAEWLNSLGVTAVVLKYRVPRRDGTRPHVAPLQDAQRAIRLVRSHTKPWAVDPGRIGVLGFSAGGHLTVMTGTQWDRQSYEKVDAADELSCRPDFLVPIYAAYLGSADDSYKLSPLVRVTERTPPTFMAVTYDDKHRAAHAALLLVELKKAGVPAELHVYSRGGHGYGMRPSDNPASNWPQRCEQWMRVSGLLEGWAPEDR